MTGPNIMAGAATSNGNGEHFNPSFHHEYPPFVGRGDRLASESYIFT